MQNKQVFVVHGRNITARDEMFSFLHSLGLSPIEWNDAVQLTGQASPFIGDILDIAFKNAQALIVLLTGDEIVKLRDTYARDHEKNFDYQARANVIFEAGMAFGMYASRTIIVQIGKHRDISDISGRHIIYLTNSVESKMGLINRLKIAGCDFDIYGKTQWIDNQFTFEDCPINESLAYDSPLSRVYSSRKEGQNFEEILSMCHKNLTVVGVKFGMIMQQMELVRERLLSQQDFSAEFYMLSPIDKEGKPIEWIDVVEDFNSFKRLNESLKIVIRNLRDFKESIDSCDKPLAKRLSIKLYSTFPTCSMVFYDKDSKNAKVKIEPFHYRVLKVHRMSYDIDKDTSPELYKIYYNSLNAMKSHCMIDIFDSRLDKYLTP